MSNYLPPAVLTARPLNRTVLKELPHAEPIPLNKVVTPPQLPTLNPNKKVSRKEAMMMARRKKMSESISALVNSNPTKSDVQKYFEMRSLELTSED